MLAVAVTYMRLLMISGINGDSAHSELHVLSTRAITDPETYSFHLLNGFVQMPDGT